MSAKEYKIKLMGFFIRSVMVMTSRREKILKKIVLDHIDSGSPVSSRNLASFFNLSSATIRNEMMALESEGYLSRPHISSGRVPTEKGYRYYITRFLDHTGIPENQQRVLNQKWSQAKEAAWEKRYLVHKIARLMARFSGETVIVAFRKQDVFYTGISYLFSKPEFMSQLEMLELSLLLDELNEILYDLYDEVGHDVEVLVGNNNPLGRQCSSIMTKCYLNEQDEEPGVLGILGPMRMEYDYNISLLKYCRDLMNVNH